MAIGTAIAAGAAGLEEMVGAILDANRACGLPVTVPYDAATLAASAMNDKKRKGASITLVLPERIGLCRLETIDISLLEDAFTRGIAMVEAAR